MGLRPPMVMKTAPVFWKRLPLVIPRACDLIPVSVEATRMEQCFAMGRSAKRQLGQGAVAHCLAGHTVLDPFCFRGARSFLLIQLGFS